MSCYHRKSFVWCLWFVYLLQSRKAENCLFQTVCELWSAALQLLQFSIFTTEKVEGFCFFRISWSSLSGASVLLPTVQPVEMYQTSFNTFRSQQHILGEWGEQCGGYINQLSKYSMSVSLCFSTCVCMCARSCVCCRHWRVQRQAVLQQRDVCTRRWRFHLCVWAGLHWCPVWDRWAGGK